MNFYPEILRTLTRIPMPDESLKMSWNIWFPIKIIWTLKPVWSKYPKISYWGYFMKNLFLQLLFFIRKVFAIARNWPLPRWYDMQFLIRKLFLLTYRRPKMRIWRSWFRPTVDWIWHPQCQDAVAIIKETYISRETSNLRKGHHQR